MSQQEGEKLTLKYILHCLQNPRRLAFLRIFTCLGWSLKFSGSFREKNNKTKQNTTQLQSNISYNEVL